MKKMSSIPACYWSWASVLLSLLILSGCACSPSETRYGKGIKTYTDDGSGVKSTVGPCGDATAAYTLDEGAPGAPLSEVMLAKPVSGQGSGTGDLSMVIQVSDILFEFDKWVIKERYVPELDRWADYFQNNPAVTAEIQGHTDSIGSTAYNQKLSENRAHAVINYLAGKGVSARRLTASGFGETQPVATNKTKEGRQENRRVELNL